MKIKDRYKLLNYVKNSWSERCHSDFKFRSLTKSELYKFLAFYKHSFMIEESYCCNGLYECCWEEYIEAGNWELTQEKVDEIIKQTIDSTAKLCKKDSRILYRKSYNGVQVVIVARDVNKVDYVICFTNDEY